MIILIDGVLEKIALIFNLAGICLDILAEYANYLMRSRERRMPWVLGPGT